MLQHLWPIDNQEAQHVPLLAGSVDPIDLFIVQATSLQPKGGSGPKDFRRSAPAALLQQYTVTASGSSSLNLTPRSPNGTSTAGTTPTGSAMGQLRRGGSQSPEPIGDDRPASASSAVSVSSPAPGKPRAAFAAAPQPQQPQQAPAEEASPPEGPSPMPPEEGEEGDSFDSGALLGAPVMSLKQKCALLQKQNRCVAARRSAFQTASAQLE